jgi:hypothetical protein
MSEGVIKHISENPDIMETPYHDVIMKAGMSSAALPWDLGDFKSSKAKYRDYVFQHTFDQVLKHLSEPMFIASNAGEREDRRSK